MLGTEEAVLDLLKQIPQLDLRILPDEQCCGAAGTYFITHRKTADLLRQPVIDQLEKISPDYLLSSNIGCAMHLAKGLGKKPLQVLHPVSLLAQQLIEN